MTIQQQPTIINQSLPPITSIGPKSIVEHSESPTAIILAITTLIAILLGSMTGLVRVVMTLILRKTTPSQ